MSLNQAQDIQVTALYKIMQERGFITNGSAVDESKIGWARVYSNIATQVVGFLLLIVEEPVLSCRGSNIYATQQGAEK